MLPISSLLRISRLRVPSFTARITRQHFSSNLITMAKRKRTSAADEGSISTPFSTNAPVPKSTVPQSTYQAGRDEGVDTNPDHNADIIDGKEALTASPDAEGPGEYLDVNKVESANSKKQARKTPTKSALSAKKGAEEIKAYKAEVEARKAAEKKIKKEDDDGMEREDPDGDGTIVEDADAEKLEAARPPPVNSSYLPLPWKGRLGYACLNTYLRFSNPPVFTSRTCRMDSIMSHRHPLKDPSQPEHATKNRPDKDQPPDNARGQRYVEELGLANARDIPKMLLWNDKYGIKFMRLSSEMFPFASHEVHGYKLAPFASEVLAEAGNLAAKLGHRLTTHPGQFTQLGSPRPEVIKSAIRDLEHHDELLSLLKLPPQQNRDAVMILHMGGTYGDKSASLDRFRKNYSGLSQSIKNRLVLENDDVSWSVHDLLPVCEELNIPLVLDFHHHNIIFDSKQIREGTLDIIDLFPRIKATWDRKNITQKMHYSEPTPPAVTGSQRRKHNPRPATLPPCPNEMDLMIEAKDKEQALFELMRTFKLPGWDTFNNLIPHERADDNKPLPQKAKKKKTKKQIKDEIEEYGKEVDEEEDPVKEFVKEEDVGMGGPQNRVYWPPGMEEWLRPKKREIKKKDTACNEGEDNARTPATFKDKLAVTLTKKTEVSKDSKEKLMWSTTIGEIERVLEEIKSAAAITVAADIEKQLGGPTSSNPADGPAKKKAKTTPVKKGSGKRTSKVVATPTASDAEDEDDISMPDLSADEVPNDATPVKAKAGARQSGRASKKKVSYKEVDAPLGEDQ